VFEQTFQPKFSVNYRLTLFPIPGYILRSSYVPVYFQYSVAYINHIILRIMRILFYFRSLGSKSAYFSQHLVVKHSLCLCLSQFINMSKSANRNQNNTVVPASTRLRTPAIRYHNSKNEIDIRIVVRTKYLSNVGCCRRFGVIYAVHIQR
jgi:hypothetical protein